MEASVLISFLAVDTGMLLGEIPGLRLDRTGVARLGAIALVAIGDVTVAETGLAVEVPTIALLLGLMGLSAQRRLDGFYTIATQRLTDMPVAPPTLLAGLVGVPLATAAGWLVLRTMM